MTSAVGNRVAGSARSTLRTKWLLGLGAAVVLVLGASILSMNRTPAASVSKRATASASPGRAAKAAVQFPFPDSKGAIPKGLSIEYDAKKDKTKMTLELQGFAGVSSSLGSARGASIQLVSQHKGQARPGDYAELSIECLVRVVSSQAGVLAPATPPGEVRADGRTYPLKASATSNAGYRSKGAPDGVHESLAFKLATRDLLAIAKASDVQVRLGTVQLTFTKAQIADLLEFSARMKPGT